MSYPEDNSVLSKQWAPTASFNTLRQRAEMINRVRQFFASRNILEVDTPLLCEFGVTDPYIENIPVLFKSYAHQEKKYYLQTSPEYAMKRLLASGLGSIYQLCKAFRQGDLGRYHNPEFMILEWYHLNYDHHALMQEVDLFLQEILGMPPALKISYADLFQEFLNFNPHTESLSNLKKRVTQQNIVVVGELEDETTCLDLLLTHCIEAHLGQTQPMFIYDYPASQAALACIRPAENGLPPLASRFELYIHGLELANGFHELQDAEKQYERFQINNEIRRSRCLPEMEIDHRLLAALKHGLPPCAGVALGFDRLMMIASRAQHIANILSFDFPHA